MKEVRQVRPVARPPLLHVSVQENLRAFIMENDLAAGAALPPEGFLAKQLGVSRNSLREAIKALESVGILETRRGVGVFVRAFSFAPLLDNLAYGLGDRLRDVDELREIRRVLEVGLIDRIIGEISEEDIAALREVTERMRVKAERKVSFAAEDQEFHQLLFRCHGNRTLTGLIDVFWQAFYKASDFANLTNDTPMATWRDHHEIVEAIAARDVVAARRRLDAHYHGIQDVLELNRSGVRPPRAPATTEAAED
jgi:DNA-binding FadR family transcriptional regulator